MKLFNINFFKRHILVHSFLMYSYLLNMLFLFLDLMPSFVRYFLFKLSFRKYGKKIMIDYRTFFRYMDNIELHDYVSINRGCELFSSASLGTKIILHDHVTLSPNVKLYGAGHDYTYLDLPDISGDIVLEPHVWVGANSVILQGVKIGEGAVVSANSVVTKDVLSYSIVAGIPAKVVKKRIIRDV